MPDIQIVKVLCRNCSRKLLYILVIIMCVTLLVQCSPIKNKQSVTNTKINQKNAKVTGKKPFKVGIVLSIGGLGDKSYNDSAFEGVKLAADKLGIEFNYIEPSTTVESEMKLGANHLRQYAKEKYDLIIATGYLLKDGCEQVAKEYPNEKFILIDSVIDAQNITSLVFKTEEGSFLVGAVAGLVTKTNKIGFILAQDIELLRNFQRGYEQGITYVKPDALVITKIVGGSNPFLAPDMGNKLANVLIDQGADVIYTVAGSTGIGVIEACKERGVYAIGVDNDQDYIAKGTVITSMMKKVNVAVYNSIELAVKGNLKPGIIEFGVANEGIGTSDFKYTKDLLPKGTIQKLDKIKEDIISGEIKIKTDSAPLTK